MAIKTFTTGEVLTASDTNTYLANAGLVYVKSGNATSGTFLSITNCFSSSYHAYKIVISNFTTASPVGLDVRLQVGTTVTSTGYYYQYVNGTYASTSTYSQIGASNASNWSPLAIGAGASEAGGSSFEVFNPFIATTTTVLGARLDSRTSGSAGPFMGMQSSATSFDGIYFSTGTTNLTNLDVVVYGYRKP